MHGSELDIPGSLMNVKQRFHHNRAGSDVKVISKPCVNLDLIGHLRFSAKFPKYNCCLKDYYATYDLIEVTLRMNLVALALPMIAECGPLTSYKDLKTLVNKLLERFLTWEKFSQPGLRSCPNLASKDTVDLHSCPEVEPVVDLPNSYIKRLRGEEDDEEQDHGDGEDEQVDEVEGGGQEEVTGGREEPEMSGRAGDEDDTYQGYVKGS